ncbi:MAG TPA: hypothetical protein VJ898_05530 [Natrialbaceae archaeon]|nr:hypothetical protein [Natrialbaceae archaeon]
MSTSLPIEEGSGDGKNRRRAALATLPFLSLGLIDVVLLLEFGLDPLWGFAILPPILFVSVLTWLAFSTGFLDDREELGEGR